MKSSNIAPLSFDRMNADTLRTQLDEFGFARVSNVFSPDEMKALGEAVTELTADTSGYDDFVWNSPSTDGGMVVQRVSRANAFSPEINELFLQSQRLVELGSWIFDTTVERVHVADGTEGSDGVVLVIKDPANASVHRDLRWHRDDTFTQHLPINPFVNCGLYLDRSDADRGALLVIPGSHRSRSTDTIEETIDGSSKEVSVEADPGDLLIHRADVLHRSGPHLVPGELRRVLYANIYAK